MATTADQIIAYGMKEIGKPYVWGDEGPNAFDCSGLMEWVFGKAGIKLPRVADKQQDFAKPITRSQARAGDLVFWGSPAYHVGLYLGGGRVLHAPEPGDKVKISDVWGEDSSYGRVSGVGGAVADIVDVVATRPIGMSLDGIKKVAGDTGLLLVVCLGGAALLALGAWQTVKGGNG